MFNVFRIAGDLTHCASIYLLFAQIFQTRSVSGLSFKTQLLYFIVYCTRYVDLFIRPWTSLYNTFFKFVYLGTSGYTLYLMQNTFRSTHSHHLDTFKIRYLFAVSAILAILFHLKFTVFELLWSFSIWLESLAILPQLFMVQRTGKASTLTSHYIFALGAYRVLYLLNWVYRLWNKDLKDWVSVIGGLVQTVLYSDFFYVYYTKVVQGQSFSLPV